MTTWLRNRHAVVSPAFRRFHESCMAAIAACETPEEADEMIRVLRDCATDVSYLAEESAHERRFQLSIKEAGCRS